MGPRYLKLRKLRPAHPRAQEFVRGAGPALAGQPHEIGQAHLFGRVGRDEDDAVLDIQLLRFGIGESRLKAAALRG